jgi:hypothetical protein
MITTNRFLLNVALFLGLTLPCLSQTTPPPKAAAGSEGEELAQQAADPTAPLMAFNLKEEYYSSFYGNRGSGNDFVFQPVIPFNAWGTPNLLRATVNYNLSGPGGSELNSVSIFDLIVFNEKWDAGVLAHWCNSCPAKGRGQTPRWLALRLAL